MTEPLTSAAGEVPDLLSAVESRPLDERAEGYLEVLERLRGRLEDPTPE